MQLDTWLLQAVHRPPAQLGLEPCQQHSGFVRGPHLGQPMGSPEPHGPARAVFFNALTAVADQGKAFQLMVRSVFLSLRDRRGCSVNQEGPDLEDEQAAFIHRRSSTATRAITGLDATHARHSFHLPGGHYHDWVA